MSSLLLMPRHIRTHTHKPYCIRQVTEMDVPSDLVKEVEERRAELVERISEVDDEVGEASAGGLGAYGTGSYNGLLICSTRMLRGCGAW